MQDALKRQLEKGDIVVSIGSYSSKIGIVTQQDVGFMRGINVYFTRSLTKDQTAAVSRLPCGSVEYHNVRYELKFGKLTSRRPRRLVKMNSPLSDFEEHAIPYPKTYLHQQTMARMKEVYREAMEYCIKQVKAGQPVKVPKELRYIEKCTLIQ